MTLQDFMTYFLTPAVGAISWFASRFVEKRKRNNDFISELQKTIDVLVTKYTETLKELVELKAQNAQLLMGQTQMDLQMKQLKAENAKFREEIERLNEMLTNIKSIRVAK